MTGTAPDFFGDFAQYNKVSEIEDIAFQGLCDKYSGIRFLCYQIMLRVLPLDPTKWTKTWESLSNSYYSMVSQIPLPVEEWPLKPSDRHIDLDGFDFDLLFRLNVDLNRTDHHLQFISNGEDSHIHMHRIQRILYQFAKVNSTYAYIQGFHELLFPFYYVTIRGCSELGLDECNIEPITFFLLQGLIVGTEFGEFFFMTHPAKVHARFFTLTFEVLRYIDTSFFDVLNQNPVEPLIFTFPWANILFCQMYPIPQLLHIWDVLLANRGKMSILIGMTVAHILRVKRDLKEMTAQAVLELVHRWAPKDEYEQISKCKQIMSIIEIKGDFTL